MKLVAVHLALLILVICIAIIMIPGCSESLIPSYFPPNHMLRGGIVHKYLWENEKIADIYYHSYQLEKDNILHEKIYNVNHDVVKESRRYYSNGAQYTLSSTKYNTQGIAMPVVFEAQDTLYQTPGHNRSIATQYIDERNNYIYKTLRKDSVIEEVMYEGAECLLVRARIHNDVYYEPDVLYRSTDYGSIAYFAKDIGMIRNESVVDGEAIYYTLMEQMSLKYFLKLKPKFENRIAFIDSSTAILSAGFKICNDNINDYYNVDGSERENNWSLTYKGGKRAILNALIEGYDAGNHKNQSGHLSYHFVVNCMGETGRFLITGHDFDYIEKTFDQELQDQFLKKIHGLDDWKVSHYRGRDNDSYMYITIILKNGEIIDILP